MNDLAVQVANLRREFGPFVAVDNISFEVKKGEIFGFLGPNGAGKSTTIRMLCGLLRPTSGGGTVAGFDIMTESERIKTKIGYMSQRFSLYQTLTVEENLNFYAGVYLMNKGLRTRRKEEFFSHTELGHVRNRLVAGLPVGTKQLLALFCAVQHHPEMIFLDEPTAGVDPIARRYFWEQINQVASRGMTVFVTTHHLDEAEECGRIAMIFAGRLAAIGKPAELKQQRFAGTVHRLHSDQPWETADLLRRHRDVADVALFGTELHVTLKPGAQPVDVFDQIAASTNQRVEATQVSPSLEDLFISLIREEQK